MSMKIIGLTGGIASGKSTVSAALAQLGARIIDADKIAREILRPGCPAVHDIRREFGSNVLTDQGEIDRPKLARLVFNSDERRAKLNGITHSRIREEMERRLAEIGQSEPGAVAVIDAPLLIEAGMTDMVEEIWLTVLPEEMQISRLIQRDSISREEAVQRIRSQMPLVEKIPYATRQIDTSGSMEETIGQVALLWQDLKYCMPGKPTE